MTLEQEIEALFAESAERWERRWKDKQPVVWIDRRIPRRVQLARSCSCWMCARAKKKLEAA